MVILVLSGERKRSSLRVTFTSVGQIMKTAIVVDVLEVLMSFTVKKPMVPDSEESIYQIPKLGRINIFLTSLCRFSVLLVIPIVLVCLRSAFFSECR